MVIEDQRYKIIVHSIIAIHCMFIVILLKINLANPPSNVINVQLLKTQPSACYVHSD